MLDSLYFCICIMLIQTQATATSNKNRGSCDLRCGSVDIHYPFGIGENCFYDKSFAIVCNYSSSSSSFVPVLKTLNLEVTKINFNPSSNRSGTVTIKTPMVTTCSDDNNSVTKASWTSPNFEKTPFSIDENDIVFASEGCDGYAALYDEKGEFVVGCVSVCSPNLASKELNQTECVGFRCCQTEIDNSSSLRGYTVDVRVGSGSESCRSAFLVSKEFYIGPNYNASFALSTTAIAMPLQLTWSRPSRANWYHLALFIGPSVGTFILSGVILWFCWLSKTQKRRKEIKLRAKYFHERLKEEAIANREVIKNTKLFTMKELNIATNNFHRDRILGQGGQGTVYKGVLVDRKIVAIKKSRALDESQLKQFVNEVILLSQIKHRHVVKLLGCCLESKEPLVVYEFISNGTLFDHIHNSTKDFSCPWEMRVRIASEIANAIDYLHSGSSTPIFHRDIKSSNILLDDKYIVKVSDFGIARAISVDQTHLTTCVQGTFGYLDPEYFRFSRFSEKSDVYSFGVVLVELLTGQQPIRSPILEGGGEEEAPNLVELFMRSMNNSTLDDILDPRVLECNNVNEHIMTVADLARKCLNPGGIQRPTMKEVTIVLDGLSEEICNVFP